MAFWSSFGLSNGMAAAAAAATVAVAGFVGFQFLGEADAPAPGAGAPAGAIPELGGSVEPGLPEIQTPEAVPEPEVAASAPLVPDADPIVETDPAGPVAPSFDLVRVDAAGGAVIAGRAAANADLRLRLDGQEILMAGSDGTGSFVAMLSIPPSDLPQVLSLEMVLADGGVVISDQSVIIQPATGLAAAEPAPDASPDLPDIDTDLPELASIADPAPVSATPQAPQLANPDGTGAAPVSDAEFALLETEAPGAGTAADPAPPAPDDAADRTEGGVAPAQGSTAAAPQGSGTPASPVETPPVALTPDTAEIASVAVEPEPPVATEATSGMPQPGASDPSEGSDTTGPQIAGGTPDTPEPLAPTVMIADAQGIRVLQSGGPEPEVQVVLDTISYDTEGEVVLSGRGPAQSDVRLYLDNQPVQLARIDTAGGWSTQLPQVDPGTYTLRVDEVSAEGAVLSRVETPFLREEPAVLEALPQSDGVSVITVQPGHTLWGIARERLGAGVLYVQVYEANRDLIRDPHWIYPGQIFAIPENIEGQ